MNFTKKINIGIYWIYILDILYLLGADWNHGILNDFPETVGNGKIIPTDEPIFFRGVGQPPTR